MKQKLLFMMLCAILGVGAVEPVFHVCQRQHTPEMQSAVKEFHLEMNEIRKGKAENQQKPAQQKLFDAVKRNDLKEAEKCLSKGADVNRPDEKGLVPLHYAAVCQHVEMIKWLLVHGADVNKKNRWAWTPLHYVLGSDEVTEKLCPKGD